MPAAAPLPRPSPAERTARRCLAVAALGSAAVLALTVLYHVTDFYVWDDAYMFVRYADNLLATGRLAWNPGGEATYGLTSLLYLAVVVPLRLVAPGNAALAIVASSLVCGLAFVVLLVVLVWRHAGAGPLGRRALLVLALFILAAGSYHASAHYVSGMDTMFALAYLTAYVLIAKEVERGPSRGKAVLLGVWGGLAYLARPDLMLYAALVPAALVALGGDSRMRRCGLVAGLVSAGVLAAELGGAWLVFGTALPLPFYAKGLALYGEGLRASYRWVPAAQLLQFVAYYWLPFVLVLVGLTVRPKAGGRRSAVEAGLLVATALFLAYYLGFVLQIMYMGARFYYPTLPVLVFLAVRAAARLGRRMLAASEEWLEQVPRAAWWLATALFLYALTPQGKTSVEAVRAKQGEIGRFSVLDDYRTNPEWRGYWFQLDAFAALPDDLVLATTEIGRPGVLAPRKAIVDLTGLNEPAFALHGFSAERLLEGYSPDLLYMPHPGYREMIAAIRGHPAFEQRYEHFPAERLGTTMGLALRRDSPHYPAMRAIVTRNLPAPSPGE